MYVIPGVPLPYHMCGPVLPCHISTDVSSSCHMRASWRVLTLPYVLPDRSSLYHACSLRPSQYRPCSAAYHFILCVCVHASYCPLFITCVLPAVPALPCVLSGVLTLSCMCCPHFIMHVVPAVSSPCLTCDCYLTCASCHVFTCVLRVIASFDAISWTDLFSSLFPVCLPTGRSVY